MISSTNLLGAIRARIPRLRKLSRRISADGQNAGGHKIAYEPDLVPPPTLMRLEGIENLEEWFRWAEEWSMLLRIYGRITHQSTVLEIGCGLGRVAFPLRYVLTQEGSYHGLEIVQEKVDFLNGAFHAAHPNFHFTWADINNTYYNPAGRTRPAEYHFPYFNGEFDLVYAASVFTHMLPENVGRYFTETSRVLKHGGRALFSFFLLDFYRPGQPRPQGFVNSAFNFDHTYGQWGESFATVVPDNPEQMTAFRLDLIESFARAAGLTMAEAPLPGLWSGSTKTWVGAQDLVVLTKS
jgi:SAM-dependent methyltransferase